LSLLSILFLSVLFVGCGGGPYDLSNSTDRAELKVEINNALTRGDCTSAISLSSPLFNSPYVDNDLRMLYVSAHACNAGIIMYNVYDNLTSLGGANPIGEFSRMFPSTVSDSKLQSTWAALDALQTVLLPGSVVSAADQIVPNAYNTGSVLLKDWTTDAKIYAFFLTMALIGETGNRFGSPSATYTQGADYVWTDKATVQADSTGTACALASGFLNFIDSVNSILTLLPSSSQGSVASALAIISAVETAGTLQCTTLDGYSAAQCSAASQRLRYRASCNESLPIASFAAGVIKGVNVAWQ
jgi:hypothetical protein